jgi:hypothetical protein
MSYFNHAYRKSMLAAAVASTDTATSAFGAGTIGLVDASTYKALDPTVTAIPANTDVLLVQGNYNTTDTIGGNPLHGGYSESIKSKIIKPKFITKVWTQACTSACTAADVTVTVPDDCYPCGSHPQLRIDLKGDNIQRFLGRNNYFIADLTGCCAGVEGATDFTGTEVASGWKDAINNDPTIGPFVTATNAAGVLTLSLKCPDETYFDDCSFDTRDWYGTTPITMVVSVLDDDGDACTDPCATLTPLDSTNPATTSVTTLPQETSGETVLRDLILDGRYRQDGGHNQGNKDSARFREIEGGDALIAAVNRQAYYKMYYVQHTVPRYNNPTGVFDNDQYIVSVAVLCTNAELITAVDKLWVALAGSCNVCSPIDLDCPAG